MLMRGVVTMRKMVPTMRGRMQFMRGMASVTGSQAHPETDPTKISTHFGFQEVDPEKKKPMVAEVFHRVAERYDLMNDFMSGGIHRLWKDWFIDLLHPVGPLQVLDVAGGTGDIAFRIADSLRRQRQGLQDSEITVCDINSSMLEVGRERVVKKFPSGVMEHFKFEQGDAEQLQFADNSFDVYTIAFGIRNVTHIDKVLSEAYRVLKPGGRFLCLEFSRVPNPLIRAAYDAYSFNIIPLMGGIVANNRPSYQYLVESIRQFPPQDEFKSMIETAGFKHASYTNYTLGVVAAHSGFKV